MGDVESVKCKQGNTLCVYFEHVKCKSLET